MNVIVIPWDPLDADAGLVAAVRRADDELRELQLLTDPVTGPLVEYALLVEED
jgi:hypothetical protein